MKMKDILNQKVASENLDKQLQKLAADLTLDYLSDIFTELYPEVYNQLKKVAMQKKAAEKNQKKDKIIKLLAALGLTAGGVGTAAGFLANRPGPTLDVDYAQQAMSRALETGSVPVVDESYLNALANLASAQTESAFKSDLAKSLGNILYKVEGRPGAGYVPSGSTEADLISILGE